MSTGTPITNGISNAVPPKNKFSTAPQIKAINRSNASMLPILSFASKLRWTVEVLKFIVSPQCRRLKPANDRRRKKTNDASNNYQHHSPLRTFIAAHS